MKQCHASEYNESQNIFYNKLLSWILETNVFNWEFPYKQQSKGLKETIGVGRGC